MNIDFYVEALGIYGDLVGVTADGSVVRNIFVKGKELWIGRNEKNGRIILSDQTPQKTKRIK